jgi:hypothetical protein
MMSVMNKDDLENELRNLKLVHLTEGELNAYCEQKLAPIPRARAEAHLKHCFICARQLLLLREEKEALSGEPGAQQAAMVKRLMAPARPPRKSPAARPIENAEGVPLQERLTEYLRPMVASWQTYFKQQAGREVIRLGEEVWRWQSEDGQLWAHAMMEKKAALTIHFSSSEMALEGARLYVRLGPAQREITLERISDGEVYAKVAVPLRHVQQNMADISIESA